jgi:phenylpropionate dioxygenase-like ring-hydroxylating dioxygenase large terminal subunit
MLAPKNLLDPTHFARARLPFAEAETLPTWCYYSEEFYRLEVERLFMKVWNFIGRADHIPNPGDFYTLEFVDVPVIVARDRTGELRAYANSCRHRGAKIAEGEGNGRAFVCPYHGWTYGLDGSLIARPAEESFAAAERATHGLRALPVVEKYGMIWVGPRPGMMLDIDGLLAGMGDELAAYGLGGYHHYETRVLRRDMNWKLAVDTFGETYHLQHLHPETVSPLFHSNLATFKAFGANHRMVAARRTFDELRTLPEEQWDVFDHTVVICVLFPNTVFTFQRDHVETWHIFPGDRVDRCAMYVSFYIPEPATGDGAKRHWDNNFNLLMATVEMEDFPTCEGMQRGFAAGAQESILFGRNEPALQHYHRSVTAALTGAQPRLAAE